VKAGVTEGENTQVEGINPGDVVANNGFEKLQDNARVTAPKPGVPGARPPASSAPAASPANP